MLTSALLFLKIPPAYYVSGYTREFGQLARFLTMRTKRIIVASFDQKKGEVTLHPPFYSDHPLMAVRMEGSEGTPWLIAATVYEQEAKDTSINWTELIQSTFPRLSLTIEAR